MKLQGVFTVRWQASDGKGVTIVSKYVKYAKHDSGTTAPKDGWQDSIPSITDGAFLWTWTHIEYSDGNVTDSYSVSRHGIDGKGIKSSTTDYKQMENTNISPENITGWGGFPTNLTDGWWLYTRQTVTYSDGATAVSYSVVQIGQGAYYAGLSEYYCASDSPSVPPSNYPKKEKKPGVFYTEEEYPLLFANGETIQIGNNWKSTRSEVKLNSGTPYLWNFEISRDSKGNQYVTFPSLIGNFSKGIISIVEAYAISAYDKPDKGGLFPSDITSEKDWTDESLSAAPTDEKPYQWNRTTITYNSGNPDVHYHVSAIKSKGQAYVMLENEMDSLLYDDANTLISGSVSTVARFFYNGADISKHFYKENSGNYRCFIEPSPSIGNCSLEKAVDKFIVTVNGINDSAGYVNINFVYNDVTYTKKFTVKRIVGGAKYQLECTPNVITYNTTTGKASSTKIVINVKKIGSQGVYSRLNTLAGTGLYIRKNGVEPEQTTEDLPLTHDLTRPSPTDTTALTVELLQGPVGSGVVIDAQEIPWAKSENGADGAQGNGIKSETHYCMFTMTFDQPAANDSGWVQLTDDNKNTFDSNKVTKRNRYLWLKKVYEYDNGDIRALVSLLSQYVDGVEANLLRETAFASDGDMEAWEMGENSVTYIAYNAFGNNNAFVREIDTDYVAGTDDTILRQYIKGENSKGIITPNTWYTLSFYARNNNYFTLDEKSSINGEYASYDVHLKAGCTVSVIYDFTYNTHYTLKMSYQSVDFEGSATLIDLDNDKDGSGEVTFTPAHSGKYTLRFGIVDSSNNWFYDSGNSVQIFYIHISRGMGIDAYASFMDINYPVYHNGSEVNEKYINKVKRNCISWNLSTEWQHCWVTFKSKGKTGHISLLLNNASNTTSVCMPKLEENTAATAWIENHLDRVTEQASHILAGDWKENTTYYYLQGVRQVVRYYNDSTKTETRFYRLRKKTSPTGYKSSTPPYEDTEHWEEANHMPFFSSDFVLSEEIMAKIMQVVQLKADEIITRSLVAMRNYETLEGTMIQQKIASINEPQYPDGAIVQYWKAASDEDAYNPKKKMVIVDGEIQYYDKRGNLKWTLTGDSGVINTNPTPPPTTSYSIVYYAYVCALEANPSLVDSIKTSDSLSGSEYRLYISSLTKVYKDTNDKEINGWYTDAAKPIMTEFNDKGFKPAFKYYRKVYKIENGINIQEKIIYFNTSENVIL